MKTTIITLTYNHEGYIREALASALAQSRPADEVIVIDDASSDRTADAINDYLRRSPSPTVRFVRNEKNLGLSGSLAKAVAVAQGDIIFLMSGDDVSSPMRIERCLDYFAANPSAMAVITNASIIDVESRVVGKLDNTAGVRDAASLSLCDLAPGDYFLRGRSPCGATAAYRAEVFHRFPLLRAGLYAEDEPLAFRAMLLGTCDFLPDQLVRWRRHGSNLSHGTRERRGPEMAIHFRRCEAMVDQMLSDANRWASEHPGLADSISPTALNGLRFNKAKWMLWAAAHEQGVRLDLLAGALCEMVKHRLSWVGLLGEIWRPTFRAIIPFPVQRLLAVTRHSS